MKLFTLDFINIYYDEKNKLIEYKWKKNSEHLTDEKYRETISDLIKIVKTFEPTYILGNLSDQNFALPTDTQKWVADEALQKIFEFGVKKLALINSQYFLAKNIYQNLVEGLKNVRLFSQRQEAIDWLFENNKQESS